MTRTKALNALVVPHIRGKPVTWLTPLPPNRGPTEADVRHAVTLQTEEQRLPLKRGTSTDHRIRGPNLSTALYIREGPTRQYFAGSRCRGDTRASDIDNMVFTCGILHFGREADAAG